MKYAAPRIPRIRLPRLLRRSAASRPSSHPAQSGIPASTAIWGSSVPTASLWQPAGPLSLRDAEAFRAQLFAVVEAEMSKLTDARAVDEWHREVLDPRVAAEVEIEVRSIETAARQRHTAMAGDQVAIRAEVAQVSRLAAEAEAALEQARQGVRVARARLDQRRTGAPAEIGDGVVGYDTHGELAAIRAQSDSHRGAIARTLKSVRADSEQQLASAALAAEQAVADFDRRIAEQEQIVERAAVDVRAAHDRYRGADPIAGTEAAAAPEPMIMPNPTAGQPSTVQDTTLGEAA